MSLHLQIYKNSQGYSYAVAELLTRTPEKEDIFLREVKVKVFQRTGRLILFESLDIVRFFKIKYFFDLSISVCGCTPSSCLYGWDTYSLQSSAFQPHSQRRETGWIWYSALLVLTIYYFNQDVIQTGTNFSCIMRPGRFFLVNALAFAGIFKQYIFIYANNNFSVDLGCSYSAVL